MENKILVDNLGKVFQSQNDLEINALSDLNLSVAENEFVCILGPSGCGKSTLLRIIACLEKASCGTVFYNGREHTPALSGNRHGFFKAIP